MKIIDVATHHKCKETVLGLALGVALGVASRSGRRRSGQLQAKLSCEGLSTLFGMLRILMPGSKLKMLTSELLLNCLVGDHIEPWWMSLFPSRERETAPGSAKNAALFLVEGDNLEGRPGQSCPLSLGWTPTDPQRFSDQERVHRLLLTALKAEVLLAEGCCIRQGLSRQRTNMWWFHDMASRGMGAVERVLRWRQDLHAPCQEGVRPSLSDMDWVARSPAPSSRFFKASKATSR